MADFKPTRRTVMTLGVATVVGGGGAFLLEGGSGPDTPQCSTSPPVDLDPPSIGTSNVPVPIVAYTDFSCPHCKDYELDVVPKIRQRFLQSQEVTYTHRDFPLPVDDWSRPAASAARSVQRQTDDATFFEYSHKLYQNQDSFSYSLFGELANSVGADGKQTRTAAQQNRYCKTLNQSLTQGSDRGVSGTPTVYVADQKLEAPGISEVANAVQQARSGGTNNSSSS